MLTERGPLYVVCATLYRAVQRCRLGVHPAVKVLACRGRAFVSTYGSREEYPTTMDREGKHQQALDTGPSRRRPTHLIPALTDGACRTARAQVSAAMSFLGIILCHGNTQPIRAEIFGQSESLEQPTILPKVHRTSALYNNESFIICSCRDFGQTNEINYNPK